ncbi:MAG: hypothetical protein U5R31_01380 [Acidimicrobiia bacterium]|nr:hypothetical protein [Acidimicrobiia bacterium]
MTFLNVPAVTGAEDREGHRRAAEGVALRVGQAVPLRRGGHGALALVAVRRRPGQTDAEHDEDDHRHDAEHHGVVLDEGLERVWWWWWWWCRARISCRIGTPSARPLGP